MPQEQQVEVTDETSAAASARSLLASGSRPWLLLAGGLLILGSVLPWAQTEAASFAGVRGDGVLTLAIGAIIGALAFLRPSRTTAWFVLGMAIVSILIVFNVYDALQGNNTGVGLLIAGAGAVAAVAASVRTWSLAPNPRPRRPKPG